MPHPAALEATVTSKGQITLPKLLREQSSPGCYTPPDGSASGSSRLSRASFGGGGGRAAPGAALTPSPRFPPRAPPRSGSRGRRC